MTSTFVSAQYNCFLVTSVTAGADERNANRVGDALVLSNLSGVDTRDIFHLPVYVYLIKEGLIVPTAWPEIVTETPSTALVRRNWTFGHVVAKYATDLAARKAEEQNVAVVSFMQATHIGRLGEYPEIAASQGRVCQIWASGYGEDQPVAVPYGGQTLTLHTVPYIDIDGGFPGGSEPPMVLDFATTAIAGSKVTLTQQRGQQVPPNSLADKESKPTTDPSVWPAGGLLPFGGHKGYALMLANELMGRELSGTDGYAETHRGGPTMRHQGVTTIVFKADLFQPQAEFTRRTDELGQRMRAVPPAAGFDEVLVPGDLEERVRATRRRDGIPVLDDVWQSLVDLAEELGVSLPSV